MYNQKAFTHKLNDIYNFIRTINKKGYKFETPMPWKSFTVSRMHRDNYLTMDLTVKKVSDELISVLLTEDIINKYKKEYEEYLASVLDNIRKEIGDYQYNENLIDSDLELFMNWKLRTLPFYLYIKNNILKADLSKSSKALLDHFHLEYYDLNEKTKDLYRNLGAKLKKANNQYKQKHFRSFRIKNIIDIDIGWNSDEEWVHEND